jgi:hypothetical protein
MKKPSWAWCSSACVVVSGSKTGRSYFFYGEEFIKSMSCGHW